MVNPLHVTACNFCHVDFSKDGCFGFQSPFNGASHEWGGSRSQEEGPPILGFDLRILDHIVRGCVATLGADDANDHL